MRKYTIALILICTILTAKSQVKLLSFEQLTQRMNKGKDTTYVVNFWATWCGPCVAELPNFEKLNQAKLREPVKVILISLDFKSKLAKEVIPFVKRNKLQAETYVINEPDQQAFIEKVDPKWSGAIPATLFVNSSRKIRAFYEKEFSYSNLIQTLKTLIK